MPARPKAVVRCALATALAAALVAATGCGAATARVRGKVTHNGKAVASGSVTLVDRTGGIHSGGIDPDGGYEIDGVAVGPAKFAVVSPNPDAQRPVMGRGKAGKDALPDPREKSGVRVKDEVPARPKPAAGPWFPLPPKFNRPDASGLTGEVVGKECVIDLDLK